MSQEDQDSSSVTSSENLTTIIEVETEHASDADDEASSQVSTSPGITLTPDVKHGPFKYPKEPSQRKCCSENSNQNREPAKSEKESDDGFFSGFDLEECLNENMDLGTLSS